MKKFILTVGLNDKETLTQLITTDNAKKLIMEIISEFVDGCTLSVLDGFYKHKNGCLTFETAIQIELVFIGIADVFKISKMLKNAFNQETVLFESVKTNAELI